ncbi:hypothetical protein SCHPADRAFT_45304 [Schizopora paradoxa]|uniref:BTB domain-containing protein n=1 Tax=Schizopora paradoxa TaxID=27342 RepID=A0A0H2S6K4_9AGAM|nr:hypothetical protein SCHPADRAFT_45304 [Schizopora paradoxa]
MELFDIIELKSYVTPLAERLRIAIADAQKRDLLLASPAAVATPHIRRDWTTATDDNAPPDLTLSSSDSVTFRVHQDHLLAASTNEFSKKLSPPQLEKLNVNAANAPTLTLPYPSAVVHILLHVVYKEDGRLRDETPSLADISSAIRALKECGIPSKRSILDSSLLFGIMASHCKLSPLAALEVYTLAASHAPDLHHVAVYASRFLLPLRFSRITDEIAASMGAVYLLRLSQLLVGRTQEFKRLLLPTPQLHKPLPHCDTRVLREAWTLVTAFLMWHATPDVGDATIDGLKDTVIDRIRCKRCNDSFERRFEALKHSWSLVRCTI